MTFDSGKIQISGVALRRLPGYLLYLKNMRNAGVKFISSTLMASDFNQNPVQIRKDLALVSTCPGKPKVGFEIATLIKDIENFLGYNNTRKAVVVGTGKLGRTLLSYDGFEAYGLSLIAGFDSDAEVIGSTHSGKTVYSLKKLSAVVREAKVTIGIITVPKAQAQAVADAMVKAGIRAIWNFAPTHIVVPNGVAVKYENLAASLALLSKKLDEGTNE